MGEATNGHRVLVVDDEPNIVDVVSMALRFQGFSVESAGTGAEAVSAVGAFHPHLIVLDVMLPDMEGFEVARRLGAQHARVPIIYLTARDATEDKIRGLTLGGDDYVTKRTFSSSSTTSTRGNPTTGPQSDGRTWGVPERSLGCRAVVVSSPTVLRHRHASGDVG